MTSRDEKHPTSATFDAQSSIRDVEEGGKKYDDDGYSSVDESILEKALSWQQVSDSRGLFGVFLVLMHWCLDRRSIATGLYCARHPCIVRDKI